MSRAYELEVGTTGISKEEVRKILVERFGWQETEITESAGIIWFTGQGGLCGGQSEEVVHAEISAALKKVNAKAKVKTVWTYLEEFPITEYGDEL